jgi:hypothetical protein
LHRSTKQRTYTLPLYGRKAIPTDQTDNNRARN